MPARRRGVRVAGPRRLIAPTPADQLGDRFGRIAGTIGDDGLRPRTSWRAVVGRDADGSARDGARVVTALERDRRYPRAHEPVVRILVVIAVIGALAPVAVFVASATRLSAARREQRLAAHSARRSDPGPGRRVCQRSRRWSPRSRAPSGSCCSFLLRPLVAIVPFGQATWFADAIVPPLLPASRCSLLVQVVGIGGRGRRAAPDVDFAARRRSPRAERDRSAVPRLLPLVLSLGGVRVGVARLAADRRARSRTSSWILGGGFFGMIVSIAIAGPWITRPSVGAILARLARGPARCSRPATAPMRPRGAFGAIARRGDGRVRGERLPVDRGLQRARRTPASRAVRHIQPERSG